MLDEYVQEVRDLLNDSSGQFFDRPRLVRYINRARRRIAYASGCIRVMPAGTQTIPRQEFYPVGNWTSLVQAAEPGVQYILVVRSLAIALGGAGWKPLWQRIIWTDFQARFRVYNSTFFGTWTTAGWWTQYGLGPKARLYLAPIPAQRVPMEVDLTCIPSPLLDDDDPEPLQQPWQDAVSYWAATHALMQQQRREDAQAMATLFNNDLPFCASVVMPQLTQTPYGAVIRSA